MSVYNLAIKYLNEYYGLSKVDYKLYYSNLLRNNRYIDDYQEIHRNVTDEFPHTVLRPEIQRIQRSKKYRIIFYHEKKLFVK